MAKLGLVTVLFNSNDVLDGFLKSIGAQNFLDYHLYLIDNTPSLKTDEVLYRLLKCYEIENYTHIKNDHNVGVAKGNNQGITLSIENDSSYTLLLNNDIEFDDVNLFSQLINEAVLKKEALIIPKILFYDSKKIWMAGGKFILNKGITNHVGEGEEDQGKFDHEAYFEYAPTCFMMIDNLVFKEIGIMDEKYFVYFDDTDFLFRASKKGFRIKYMPQLVILHKVSSSTGGTDSLFTLYYANRNRLFFIRKNFKGWVYFKAISYTLTSRIIKFINYDTIRRRELVRAVLDGLKM